ncbi:glycosyltransferase family 25 protein [Hydrogenophaga sp. PAMC20947]|uniref:glycosyltransferase family 25 protein n=1 Tax=Hydrogenophaga sp. PAMC20947 TaxID=2565558 RepID=UPI00109D8AF4|nr:glycosyltransferase family 25 protein [Hydrogenophaga sp. PAMC20947]QCB45302.1 hypothetical protein E5678_04230 [Hydrogenophaga sp. PAMC20947]
MTNLAAYILAVTDVPERVEDAENLQQSLNSLRLFDSVEIVPAIYWKNESSAIDFISKHPDYGFTERYLTACRKGQACCTLSHISLWQNLLNSVHDGAMVFEDDIYVEDSGHLREIAESISRRPDIDWLRIHLHKAFRDEILQSPELDIFVNDPSVYGFAAYYVSRQGAEKLLRNFQTIDNNVDVIVPELGRSNRLTCRTVHKVVVEHHPFDGDVEDLAQRHEIERLQIKLQKSPSTIYSSPCFQPGERLHRMMMIPQQVRQLKEQGYTVLRGVFAQDEIVQARSQILANHALFKNTRSNPSSLHLAGFHRFPELESLHTNLATNEAVLDLLAASVKSGRVRTIGLSDITINRSQNWHKDLLRGKFRHHLGDESTYWNTDDGGVYKALLYLQKGASLKVIEGSHLEQTSLNSDSFSEPTDEARVREIPVEAGDTVIMDIRVSHRGSPEVLFQPSEPVLPPRILISTVSGCVDGKLTKAMEIGNFHRLVDWMERHP